MRYCIYCGKENKETENSCVSCGRKLISKDHLLKDYIKAHVIDEASGKMVDTIGDFIQAFVKKYLYGIVLAISIVATTTSLVTHSIINQKENLAYQEVEEKPIQPVVFSSLRIYVFDEYIGDSHDCYMLLREDGTFFMQIHVRVDQVNHYYGTYEIIQNQKGEMQKIRFHVKGLEDDFIDIGDKKLEYKEDTTDTFNFKTFFYWKEIDDISEIDEKTPAKVFGK